MVYMYVLWAGSGDPPSPWQKVATWDGRYLACHSNPQNAGSTGGSNTHTHTTSNFSCGNATFRNLVTVDWERTQSPNHTHSLSSVSVSTSSNEPPYYTLSLIRIDLNTWLNSVRTLPVGAVVPSMAAISESGYSSWTDALDKFVKLGSPGQTGGSSSHNHSVSASLASNRSYVSVDASYEEVTFEWEDDHTHTFSAATQVASNTPPYVQTRFYRVTSNTYKTPRNVVCFFDGNPTGPFDVITGWDNRLLKVGSTDPATGGSSSHNHGTVSGNSSGSGIRTWRGNTESDSGYTHTVTAVNHTHPVSLQINDAGHMPSYVYLLPAYLTQDLWAWTTYQKSHTTSVALAARKTQSITSQMLLIRPGSRTLNSGLVLKKVMASQIGADIRILKRFDKPYLANIVLFKTLRMIYAASLVLNPTPLIRRTYSAGIRIVNPNLISPPNTTVIDTLLKSYVDQLDKVQRQLQLLHLRHRLDLATGTDLDEIWGQAFQLPRYLNEPDDVYRKRIQLHILTILASGTKPGCEEVLGELVEDPGSVRVESEWPATVRVHFDTDRAVRNADYFRGMLEYLRTRLFAAGVNVVYHITYADLVADIVTRGTVETEYGSNLMIEQPDLETSYSGGLVSVLGQSIDFNADLYLLRRPLRQLRALMAARKALEIRFACGLACKTTHEMSGEIGLVLMSKIRRDYSASVAHLKRGLIRSHASGIALQRGYSVPIFGSIRLELRGGAQYSGGIRIVGGSS